MQEQVRRLAEAQQKLEILEREVREMEKVETVAQGDRKPDSTQGSKKEKSTTKERNALRKHKEQQRQVSTEQAKLAWPRTKVALVQTCATLTGLWITKTLYMNVVVVRLPFEPLSMFQPMLQYGLENPGPSDGSHSPIYITGAVITRMVVGSWVLAATNMNVLPPNPLQKMLGVG